MGVEKHFPMVGLRLGAYGMGKAYLVAIAIGRSAGLEHFVIVRYMYIYIYIYLHIYIYTGNGNPKWLINMLQRGWNYQPAMVALLYKAQTNWHFVALSGGQPPSEPPRAAGAQTAEPATELAIGGGVGLVWRGQI